MIYTCTLNPAIDYRLEVDHFQLEALNRANFNKYSAGGKGINVSIMLNHLKVDNIALGFMGGFTGTYLKDYLTHEHKITVDFTKIEDNTRINVKLHTYQKDTEINALAPKVTEEEVNNLLKQIKTLSSSDILVIAGSSVKYKENLYKKIIDICASQSLQFVIDAERSLLLESLAYKPLLIKPNLYELESLFEKELKTEEAIIEAGKRLIQKGAQNIIVSLGKDGSIFMNRDVIYQAQPIQGHVLNTVGAGDSMVGGFIAGVHAGKSLKDAYKQAVACGTATAFSYNLGTKQEIEDNLKKVKIEEVEK